MSDSEHERLESLFSECLELTPEERARFLDVRCAGNPGLRAALEDLLARDAPLRVTHERPIESIGPYRLGEKLGEGGFGEVFAAEQTAPVRRSVAIKILKPGMDSRAILTRFEAERQALALMNHPGIAKVFDAGVTDSGRSYFVMERVSGEAITTYCVRRELSTPKKLELLASVARAIEHAHSKGVIHRDLKPSNILVTETDGAPQPKVIDFGIAKATAGALGGESMHTRPGDFLGTPEYMSPEQAESGGIDVDTRTDVYSLGVVLYQLLTGVLPFEPKRLRAAGLTDVVKILREEEPPRPSAQPTTLARARELRGDLDWIVLAAMEKDRAQRYPSAAALADDIERYLRNEPLSAGPPSTIYRMRKFIRRHRELVAGTAAVFLTLVAGMATTAFQAVKARRAEAEAVRQAEVAHAVNDFLTGMLGEADPIQHARGREVTVREIVDRARVQLDRGTPPPPSVEAALRHALGKTYVGLGLYGPADSLLERAVELRQSILGAHAQETLESELALAQVEGLCGENAAARARLDRLAFVADDPEVDTGLRARYFQLAGGVHSNAGFLPTADSLLQRGVDLRRATGAGGPALLGYMLGDLAELKKLRGRFAEAESLARESLALTTEAHGTTHHHVASACARLGSVLLGMGRFDEAEAMMRRSLEIGTAIQGRDHPLVAERMVMLAELLNATGRSEEAEQIARESLGTIQRTYGELNAKTATVQGVLGHILQDRGDLEGALAHYRAGLEAKRRLFGDQNIEVAVAMNNIAALYRLMKRYPEAAGIFREVRPLFIQIHGPRHPNVAIALHNLGKTLLDAGQTAEAETTLARAAEESKQVFPAGHVNLAFFRSSYGRALGEIGRYAEAETTLASAHAQIVGALGAEHPRAVEVAGVLADVRRKLGATASRR